MNTGKQINIMVALIFLTLVAYGAYTIWDPTRADEAAELQEEKAAERGAHIFAQNCRLCHGDSGEGGALGGRLPQAVPLDRPDLQGRPGPGEPVDAAALRDAEKLVRNTITCGRVGTSMPVWGDSQGGPLNDEQIRQLTVLITTGRWDLAGEFAAELDATGIHLTQAVSPTDTELPLEDVTGFQAGNPIRIDEERMLIKEVKDTSLVVERGALASEAAEHAAGAEVFNQPPQLQTPAILQSSCGQILRGPVPTPPSAATPTAGPGTVVPTPEATATPTPPPAGVQEVTIKAIVGIRFDTDEIKVKPGPVIVHFINEDTGVPHNVAFYTDKSASEAIFGANENICTGPCQVDITFEAPDPGTYFFRCDVHPQIMTGDFIVEE